MKKNMTKRTAVHIAVGLMIAAIAAGILFYCAEHGDSSTKPAFDAEDVVTFCLNAPEQMTKSEFDEACRIVSKRADALAGKGNYRMDRKAEEVVLAIPEQYFDGMEKAEPAAVVGQYEMNTTGVLYNAFSFSGKWLVHNLDMSAYLELDPDHIVDIESGYGGFPAVTQTGEPVYYSGDVTDWSKEKVCYIKVTFDDEAADFLKDYLAEEGYEFRSTTNLKDSGVLYMWRWISLGDGRTAYLPIGPQECQPFADVMMTVMTKGVYSRALQLSVDEKRDILWEEPNQNSKVQCAKDGFESDTIDLNCVIWNGRCIQDTAALCRKQLESLGIPFALGQDKDTLVVRMPLNKVNGVILLTVCGARMNITSGWGSTLIDENGIRGAEPAAEGNRQCIEISIDPYAFVDFLEGYREQASCLLKAGEMNIGFLTKVDSADKKLTFSLYLPEEGQDVASREAMTDLICSLANAQALDAPSYNSFTLRDKNEVLIGRQHAGIIPAGLDESRFQELFTAVEKAGGKATYSTGFDEGIELVFDQWEGNFPEEALSMVEDLYKEGGLEKGICETVSFEIHTQYEGEDASIELSFVKDQYSESVLPMSGKVTCNNTDVLEKASAYIQGSSVLSSEEYDVWNYTSQY